MLVTKDEYEIDDDPGGLTSTSCTASSPGPTGPRGAARRRQALRSELAEPGPVSRESQVGFTRVVTDRATFAWVADVFVLPDHRGRGLAHWMIETLLAHPDMAGMRRFMLATSDAHQVYADCGFTPLADPGRFMEIARPPRDLYGA